MTKNIENITRGGSDRLARARKSIKNHAQQILTSRLGKKTVEIIIVSSINCEIMFTSFPTLITSVHDEREIAQIEVEIGKKIWQEIRKVLQPECALTCFNMSSKNLH